MMRQVSETARIRGKVVALATLVLLCVVLAAGARPAHAATFTVTNTNDSGAGSLRQAINDANTRIGADTINFAILGAGPHTISPTSSLPPITDPATINGYSQQGARPNTLAVGNNAVLAVELSGANLASSGSGLDISAPNSTVKGLVINRFSNVGISVWQQTATGVKVEGNYIGTDTTGTQALGNSSGGVNVGFGTPNTTIGGTSAGTRNVISGNSADGVNVSGSGSRVMGNYIGTDKNGTADLGNSNMGVSVSQPDNTIGGTSAGARNVISGNNHGVFVSGNIFESVGRNKVQGNYIGADATGATDLGNSGNGVFLSVTTDTTIGGTVAGARNVISGNDNYGVHLDRTGAAGNNKVQGNYIGTDKSGKGDLGNTFDGVHISDAPNNTVGGTSAGARNLISGNDASGVAIFGPDAKGNKVQGNYIGTDATGTLDRGNSGEGVFVDASGNTVGGTTTGARNVISGNDRNGVLLRALATPDAAGNRVLSNSIYNNGGSGIDLGGDGRTDNDAQDLDAGTNNFQNYPEISSARPITKLIRGKRRPFTFIQGTLNSTPDTAFTLQLFSSPQAVPSGNGEGQRFVGQKVVTTDANGDATFGVSVVRGLAPVGSVVTATATNGTTGDTSEFSAARTVQ